VCGIAGVCGGARDGALALVGRLNDLQMHRGPDHAVRVPAGSTVLGNTRLAIQDLSPGGQQPFVSSDGRYVSVVNGEIYNFKELVKDHGLEVKGNCDGAVIPPLFERLGTRAFAHLVGMYAIAIVDTHEDSLTLCRDPFGIKPLYVRALEDRRLVFASEIRPLASIEPRPSLDPGSLAHFLHQGALAPASSPYASIVSVPPNSFVTLKADSSRGLSTLSFEPVLTGAHPLLRSPCTDQLGEAFLRSVDLHLRADVEIALLMSSGVDSSAVAAAAAHGGRRLRGFTVAVPGLVDESAMAADAARQWGHDHTTIPAEVSPTVITDFFSAMQRPSVDGLNTYLVSRAIQAQGYRVALSGLGADEALLGYRHMRMARLLPALHMTDRVPGLGRMAAGAAERRGKTKVAELVRPGAPRDACCFSRLFRQVLPEGLSRALVGMAPQPAGLANHPERLGVADRARTAIIESEVGNYLQAVLLPDADAFSMTCSLELRVPYVNREVYAAAACSRSVGSAKKALVRQLHDPTLHSISSRPKVGFEMPIQAWMADGALVDRVADLWRDDAPVWDHVDRDLVRGRSGGSAELPWLVQWAFVVLNAWLVSC